MSSASWKSTSRKTVQVCPSFSWTQMLRSWGRCFRATYCRRLIRACYISRKIKRKRRAASLDQRRISFSCRQTVRLRQGRTVILKIKVLCRIRFKKQQTTNLKRKRKKMCLKRNRAWKISKIWYSKTKNLKNISKRQRKIKQILWNNSKTCRRSFKRYRMHSPRAKVQRLKRSQRTTMMNYKIKWQKVFSKKQTKWEYLNWKTWCRVELIMLQPSAKSSKRSRNLRKSKKQRKIK